MSFSLSVAKFAKEAGMEIHALHQAIVIELFSSVIMDTPVLEGRLRGNWIITSGEAATGEVEIEDPEGDITVAKVVEHMGNIPKGDFEVFLANNLPYAYRIEFDGWSKKKAPEGMVRKNLVRIISNIEAS